MEIIKKNAITEKLKSELATFDKLTPEMIDLITESILGRNLIRHDYYDILSLLNFGDSYQLVDLNNHDLSNAKGVFVFANVSSQDRLLEIGEKVAEKFDGEILWDGVISDSESVKGLVVG